MERRLLHRWYGNVPGEWPANTGGDPVPCLRQQRSVSAADSHVLQWKDVLLQLIAEERALRKKLDSLDLEFTAIPSNKRDRTEVENVDMRDIEVDYKMTQDQIQSIQKDQKHCYMMLRLFGATEVV